MNMDGSGIESRWVEGRGVEIFCTLHTGPEDHPVSYTMGTGSLSRGRGVKRPRSGADHPPNLAPRLKKE
jgi:hypothetical protein